MCANRNMPPTLRLRGAAAPCLGEKSLPTDVGGNFLDDGRKMLSQPSRGTRRRRDRAIRLEDMPQVSDVGI